MKKKNDVNDKLAAKDTMNTGKLEQALAQQKQAEKEGNESIVDVEGAKEVLQRSWLGKITSEKPQTNDEGHVIGYETVWVSVGSNSKMNKEGFSSLWGTLLPYMTKAAQMSYLREENIQKLLKATIRDLWSEILANYEDYEMDPENSKQVVGEGLVIMIGAINKSRDGRGMVNEERTLVEKIARRVGIEDDSEGSIFGMPSL